MNIAINDPALDIRVLREVIRRRADQCVTAMNDMPMGSAAWQRERENIRYEAFRVVLGDIDHMLNSHRKKAGSSRRYDGVNHV